MRTAGRLYTGCEVTPELKAKIHRASEAQQLSEAELLRNILQTVFSLNPTDMERYGCSDYKEEEVKE